jgi:hypothetical protein
MGNSNSTQTSDDSLRPRNFKISEKRPIKQPIAYGKLPNNLIKKGIYAIFYQEMGGPPSASLRYFALSNALKNITFVNIKATEGVGRSIVGKADTVYSIFISSHSVRLASAERAPDLRHGTLCQPDPAH